MASYPSTIPSPQFQGFSNDQEQNYYKTKMDYGYKSRKKPYQFFSARMTFKFSTAELGIFNQFYYTTLNSGSEIFKANWNIAGYNGELEFQFAENGQPKFKPLSNTTWEVTLEVDVVSDIAFKLANNNLIGYCDIVSCQYNLLNAVSNQF